MLVRTYLHGIFPIAVAVILQPLAALQNIFQLALPAVPPLISGHAIEHGLTRGLLQVEVERGVNPQSPLVNLVAAVFVLEIAANVFHKPWR